MKWNEMKVEHECVFCFKYSNSWKIVSLCKEVLDIEQNNIFLCVFDSLEFNDA